METATRTGDRLRSLRERRGWNQRDLAQRLRDRGYPISQGTISKLENGAKFDADLIPQFAEVLRADPCEFVQDVEREEIGPIGPRTSRMLEDFLSLEMGLAPEHVHAVSTIVLSLARTA